VADTIFTRPVPDWLRASLARWDLERLAERIARVDAGAAFPDRLKDADFLELLKASILENLRNIQRYLEGTLDLDDLALDEPVRFARQQAEIGSSQNALQHSYRLGMHLAIEDWGTVVIEAGIAFRVPATELAPDLLAGVRGPTGGNSSYRPADP